jgi:hypothetical protein
VLLTDLTDAEAQWVLPWVNIQVSLLLSWLLLYRVCVSLELGRPVWWIWDFLDWTDLTGVGAFCGSFQVSQAGTGLTSGDH